jgi:FkbM family methyltransferase
VHVYEPVQSFADGIASRFANNHRIHLHRSGLAGQTRQERISLASESSSIVKQDDGTRMETIQLVAARDAFQQLDGEIAVLKINIEGCEYELLDHLLDEGLLKRVRHLQVQFHEFVPEARNHRRAIRSRLRATHVERWNYPFLWEGWERRDDAK